MISPTEALQRLREGNRRFATDQPTHANQNPQELRAELVAGQNPFAIILGCSDSRVPAEIIFDQGVGDLFVIRVAGNIVAPSQIGSIEFAAEQFGTRLVVVLGHSQCGAVLATLDQLRRPTETRSPNLRSIVDRIRPAIEPLLHENGDAQAVDLLERAVCANIAASVHQLRHGSAILEKMIEQEELLIIGAEYALETGAVRFFDESPPAI